MNPTCRFCKTPLQYSVADLGSTPLANSYLTEEMLHQPEPSYPLHARICEKCFLVQVESVVPAESIFSDYAYFSSYSSSWLAHAKKFCEMAIERFELTAASHVVEVASNDGYLLRNFVDHHIPCLGIEPAANVAEVARKQGIPTEVTFFGLETSKALCKKGHQADLIIANNVLAHVPDLNDFVAGIAYMLKPEGVVSIEFPHLLNLIELVQFDTIYHEHYCYFSLLAIEKIFAAHGLVLFDVEQLPTHGGSLRIFGRRIDGLKRPIGAGLLHVRQLEKDAKLDHIATYQTFAKKVTDLCKGFTDFLTQAKAHGKSIAAYGAAAKGNTMLNVCHITANSIAYVVDNNPAKQNRYLPGSHIPVYSPEKIKETRPDYVLILPWNIAAEIERDMHFISDWGGKFVTAVPAIRIFP